MSEDRGRGDLPENVEASDADPNAGGPEGLQGGMGVSSERVGPTGPGQVASRGVRPPASRDPLPAERRPATELPQQSRGGVEVNPDNPPPKRRPPSRNPLSKTWKPRGS